ncbi:MAG TPA: hypothetical protein VKZ98_06585 [Aquaticitalea sp.]|nr:hypothetical protein [Aquaticitalea sp.]
MKSDEKNQTKRQEQNKQSLKEKAINIKQKTSDGKEINPQLKQKGVQHQPRDTANARKDLD